MQEQTTATYVKIPTHRSLGVTQYQKKHIIIYGTLENQHTDANIAMLYYGTKKD